MVFRAFALLLMLGVFVQSQDYLTCLRNNDAFAELTTQDPKSDSRGPPGYPGKRGAAGEKGEVGEKGLKGAPGTSDLTTLNHLQDYIIKVERNLLEALRNISDLQNTVSTLASDHRNVQADVRKLCQDGKTFHEKGWYAQPNGYQYMVTETRQSWQQSRDICRNKGGDLAVNGMRDLTMRRVIIASLFTGLKSVWIGLNDIDQEGRFRWVEGQSLISAEAGWLPGEPSNDGHCVELNYVNPAYKINDRPCNAQFSALCEKPAARVCA
ncbi:hepatic lectin-like [Clavelina lepadiformis]|uniref:hepatic lectin-like n=1 Tax=Clavelina lepadiformis TaxID=159417 RepID=UPI00404313D3